MLVVVEETPGLPFECAQLIVGCVVIAAFTYCLQACYHVVDVVGIHFKFAFLSEVPGIGGT
jgi:hypothetical protein